MNRNIILPLLVCLLFMNGSIFVYAQTVDNKNTGKQNLQYDVSNSRDKQFVGESSSSGSISVEQTANKGIKRYQSSPLVPSAPASAKDYAYYANWTKRDGWVVGVGRELTAEQAQYLYYYYKLSNKNSQGHWTRMEAFDSYGNPVNGNVVTYLVNQNDDYDSGASDEWKKRLNEVCRIDYIGNSNTDEVVQECAYDKDGNIVYVYSPFRIGERTFTGTYTDAWGVPVLMRTDSVSHGSSYATANVVQVIRDTQGYDSIICVTDSRGYAQKNRYGAYMERLTHDEQGHTIRSESLDLLGQRMIDDCGNCGWECTYDSAGNAVECREYDDKWEPTLTSATRSDFSCYGYRMTYDQWGRNTRLQFIDANGKPSLEQSNKTYSTITYEYNDHGQQTLQEYWDLEENPVNDTLGIHKVCCSYSPRGECTKVEYTNSNGKLINSQYEYCKYDLEYNDVGEEISETEYKCVGDSVVTSFTYQCNDSIPLWQKCIEEWQTLVDVDFAGSGSKTRRQWYLEDLQRLDYADPQGRYSITAWYDNNGEPIGYNGYHIELERSNDLCDDSQKKHCVTTTYYDAQGKPINYGTYAKDSLVVDSLSMTKTHFYYVCNSLGELQVLAYRAFQYAEDFNTLLSQWEVTNDGTHARTGCDNVLYYKYDADYTIYGDPCTLICHNEFGEPAYAAQIKENGFVFYYREVNPSGDRYYDEYGQVIDDMPAFRNMLPQAFCIEILDTCGTAYKCGLRNGDIILSYGDWVISRDLRSNLDYFYLFTILSYPTEKAVTILRHHPDKNTSEVLSLILPEGRCSDLQFFPHKIYYTAQEHQRLTTTCDSCSFQFDNSMHDGGKIILVAIQPKGDYNATAYYHFPSYNIKDAGIVLFANKISFDVVNWDIDVNDASQWYEQEMFDPTFSRIKNMYMTNDLSSLTILNDVGSGCCDMRIVPLVVDQEVYDKAISCYHDNLPTIASERADYEQKTWTEVIVADVEEDSGRWLRNNGYRGKFIVLQYNDWCWHDGVDTFDDARSKKSKNGTNIILLPFDNNSSSKALFGEVVSLTGISGSLWPEPERYTASYDIQNQIEEIYSTLPTTQNAKTRKK